MTKKGEAKRKAAKQTPPAAPTTRTVKLNYSVTVKVAAGWSDAKIKAAAQSRLKEFVPTSGDVELVSKGVTVEIE